MAAWLTDRRTAASAWAWVTSGSMAARSWPRRTTSPSRMGRATTLPDRTDLTSTLTSGSTVPISTTLTRTSVTAALPRGMSSLGPGSSFPRLANAQATPTPTTATPARTTYMRVLFFMGASTDRVAAQFSTQDGTVRFITGQPGAR